MSDYEKCENENSMMASTMDNESLRDVARSAANLLDHLRVSGEGEGKYRAATARFDVIAELYIGITVEYANRFGDDALVDAIEDGSW